MRCGARICLVVAVTVLTQTGCKRLIKKYAPQPADEQTTRPTASAPALTAPPTPVWRESSVSFSGSRGRGSFSLRAPKLDVSFYDLPPGTTVSAGGQTATADVSGGAAVSVDLGAKLAKLVPRDAFDYRYKMNPEVRVDLDFGKDIKLALDAPSMSVSYALGDLFKKAPDMPLALPLPEKPPAQHSVLFFPPLSAEPLGPALTVDAIDWVALITSLPERKGKMCGGYTKTGSSSPPSGEGRTIPLQMIDQKVSVYEVQTSKLVTSKDFKAREECPSITFDGTAKSYPSIDEQKSWLRDLRAKK